MTTDITELAQRMKAAAEKATPGQWERGDGKHGGELLVYCDDALGSAVCEATSEYNAIPKYQRIDNLDFIALANPVNILALVEALKKAQTKAIEQGRTSCELFDEVTALRQRIAELESRSVKLPSELELRNNEVCSVCAGNALQVIEDKLTAAGIKWEAE
ncbi:ead/Ea22-like family protein [Klebsiella oxytoca]|uniref:ead/Ea22-like family protein n=1 Tax=Klebsiella oxytoca TaxID=571 RepID=UPI002245CC75|nr:ead/Ea22-like family protein [Klebsiella oxytoca]MCW9635573.1 ead/Ea22-like family protein [Klebsiella oxytoca]